MMQSLTPCIGGGFGASEAATGGGGVFALLQNAYPPIK